MPDRAIIPFTVATMGGFFCGLVGAVLELQNGPIAIIAIAGSVAVALAAGSSVLGCEGEDRVNVGVLRAFFAVLLFLAIDYSLVVFLRDARFFMAVVMWIAAGVAAAMLAKPRVREPRDAAEPQGEARTA
jgi:hypothetical protein